MKSKITAALCLATFISTFGIACIIETGRGNWSNRYDIAGRTKIQKFLTNDRRIFQEMSAQLELENNHLTKWDIIRDNYELREKQANADLPADFRDAWERKILSDVEWVNYAYHLRNFNKNGSIETPAEKDIAAQKIAESEAIDNRMTSIAKSYGVKFDSAGNFIE